MHLSRLTIRNFRVIREADLVLPDKIVGVVGPNGAGKSSLVEAIAWALYGNPAARSGKEEIRSRLAGPGETCEVSLEFSIRQQVYRVVRRLVGRTLRAEVELYRGQASESVGINETKGHIGDLLGLDLKGFQTSFLAQQKELNALSDLPPAKRRDHLAGMLGIERLDRAMSLVKEDTRMAGSRVEMMERQLQGQEQLDDQIKKATASLAELNGREAAVKASAGESRTALDKATNAMDEAQKVQSRWENLRSRAEATQRGITDQEKRQKSLTDEIVRLEAVAVEKAKLDASVAELSAAEKQLAIQEKARIRLDQRQRLKQQLTKLRAEQSELSGKLADGEKRLADAQRCLNDLPADIDKLVTQQQQGLEAQREKYSHQKAELAATIREADKVRTQAGSVAEFGPESVCDRCGRTLGDDLEQIQKHLADEIEGLDQKCAILEAQLSGMKISGKDLKQRVDLLAIQQKTRFEATVRATAETKEIASLRQRLQAFEASEKELTRETEELGATPFDQEAFAELVSKVENLREMVSRRDRLSGTLERLPVARKNLSETEARIVEAGKQLEALDGERRKLSCTPESFSDSRQQLAAAQSGYERSRDDLATFTKEKELTQNSLESLLKRRDEMQVLRDELEKDRSNHYHGQKLTGLMADFRKYIISSIRPTLAHKSSELFDEMTGGKYNLVELDENYNLRVLDSGEFFGVDRFSGGEKDLANLCLRLAISQALTESAGLDRSFIILDEVFGSQDNERKDLIIKALSGLRQHFPQILLITHVEDIKDQVEQLIEVRPVAHGHSEVLVHGSSC
jgi:exonuclease SbcC